MSDKDHTDLHKELSTVFEQAIKKRSITMGMNAAEHNEHALLKRHHKSVSIQAEHAYRQTYSTRVADETKRLLRKDGSKTRELKPTAGVVDRFNGNKLRLQAEKNVRGHHKIDMANLREAELKDEDTLFARVEKRNGIRGEAKRAFNRSTDRRSGLDRRQRTRER
ncbi:MAG: hypothetical protein AAGK79_15980 [Pseudomonadota bacterium]